MEVSPWHSASVSLTTLNSAEEKEKGQATSLSGGSVSEEPVGGG